MAMFSSPTICQTVQTEIPPEDNLNETQGDVVYKNNLQYLFVSIKSIICWQKRILSRGRRKMVLVRMSYPSLDLLEGVGGGLLGVKYALLDDAEEWRPTWFPSVSVI